MIVEVGGVIDDHYSMSDWLPKKYSSVQSFF